MRNIYFTNFVCLIDWYSYNKTSGIPSLSEKTIHNIAITIPMVDEQLSAANILSKIASEISE